MAKTTEEIEHDRRAKAFQAELQEFLESRWDIVGPNPGDGLDDDERAELGQTYLSGWVLVVSASSIEPGPDQDTEHVASSFTMNGQNPATSAGLLSQAVRSWNG